MLKEMKYSLVFVLIVLPVTWIIAIFLFSDPETVQFFPFVMFIPAMVGIVINSIRYKSIRLVFKPITNFINLKSILFSVFFPIAFICLIAVVVSISGIGKLNAERLSDLKTLPTIGTIVLGFFLMFGEEYGWRGFLLKDLAETRGKVFGVVVVGIVWAFWHGPVVYGLANHTNMEHPLLLTVIQMGAVFVASVPIAYSYFLTNNIFAPMLFHFFWNFYNPLILGNIYSNTPGIVSGNMILINGEGLAGVILGSLLMFWFFRRMKTFQEEPLSK